MFIKLNNNYYEIPMDLYHLSPWPNSCLKCNKKPDIYSIREKQEGGRVKLIGIEIRCNFCLRYINILHRLLRTTIHPDDSTVYLAIAEWNEINEKEIVPLRKRIALQF